MSEFVLDPPSQASVAVAGSDVRFAVRRIFCVGRNYAAHAREMGKDPDREAPFFFTKPADAVLDSSATIPYPPLTQNLHYEAELVVAMGAGGVNISQEQALDHVWGYACGVDLTRRDLQTQAKNAGRPWDWGKAFDRSAPCAPLHSVEQVGHLDGAGIGLKLNGETKQSAHLSDMIWSVPEIISILSRSVALCPGDLVFTGTPAGVGPMVAGDSCTVEIDGLTPLQFSIAL